MPDEAHSPEAAQRQQYRQFILDHLREHHVVSTTVLESMIFERLPPIDPETTIEGRTTKKWQNDIHLARAWLTQSGHTLTVHAGGQDWLCLKPSIVGEVRGEKLTPFDDAVRQIAGLIQEFAKAIG